MIRNPTPRKLFAWGGVSLACTFLASAFLSDVIFLLTADSIPQSRMPLVYGICEAIVALTFPLGVGLISAAMAMRGLRRTVEHIRMPDETSASNKSTAHKLILWAMTLLALAVLGRIVNPIVEGSSSVTLVTPGDNIAIAKVLVSWLIKLAPALGAGLLSAALLLRGLGADHR
jgi:hypothetical protein